MGLAEREKRKDNEKRGGMSKKRERRHPMNPPLYLFSWQAITVLELDGEDEEEQ